MKAKIPEKIIALDDFGEKETSQFNNYSDHNHHR